MNESISRVELLKPLTPQEEIVCLLVAHGHNYRDIGERLQLSHRTIEKYAEEAGRKIPGDLPAQMKMVVYMRGGSMDVLTGDWLRSPQGAYRRKAEVTVSSPAT